MRAEQPPGFSRGGSAPGAGTRRPVMESPKVSSWSTGARTTSSQRDQSSWGTPQPSTRGDAPKASTRSSSPAPAAAPQSQPVPRSYQSTPAAPSRPSAPRPPQDWKQGTPSGPGPRSDAGQPGLNSARAASENAPALAVASSGTRSTRGYQPGGSDQASDSRATYLTQPAARGFRFLSRKERRRAFPREGIPVINARYFNHSAR